MGIRQDKALKNWNRGQRQSAGTGSLWLLIVLGILSGVLLYWYTVPQKAPSWVRGRLPGMPEYTGPLYRWHDGRGQLQITGKPPRNQPSDIIQYRSDTNVVLPKTP